MARLEDMTCCGIKELEGIQGSSPESIVNDIAEDWFSDTPRAFIVFSCQQKNKAGNHLATYIKRNGLGSVVRDKAKYNPNSGNPISVWLWRVNNAAIRKIVKRIDPDFFTNEYW